ncbi:MAG TPA: hypothetical protein VFF98_08210 [Novosphingobium sp.]|nr:hypothetical protein [Novosphingobium sp.]HZV11153.1 hypothetical protein [Novosphingobium sp.]
MALRLPLCLFNRHAPDRNRVKWDGLHFIGKCRFCGKPIRRRDKGRWEKDWLTDTGKAGRLIEDQRENGHKGS